jgi:tRNA pseudouridine38-40 synthase
LDDKLARVVLILEYKGTNYCGFQFQDNTSTIQSEIEKALVLLTGETVRVSGSSRTDSGVHATGQVVSFRTSSKIETGAFREGLNHYLPPDIAVKESYKVNMAFNVQKEAISRQYQYRILNCRTRSPLRNEFCYQVKAKLETVAMDRASKLLIGEHDLASFITSFRQSVIKSTLREVYRAQVYREGDLVILDITARSFLPHQMRNTAGTLIRVGLGKLDIDEFKSIMEAKKPGLAGPTAPPQGLCLIRVNYPRPLGDYNEDL